MKLELEPEFQIKMFRKKNKPAFLVENFQIFAISLKNLPVYITKDLYQDEIIGKFHEKSRKKVQIKGKSFYKLEFYRSVVIDLFTTELVSNAFFKFYPNISLVSLAKS